MPKRKNWLMRMPVGGKGGTAGTGCVGSAVGKRIRMGNCPDSTRNWWERFCRERVSVLGRSEAE